MKLKFIAICGSIILLSIVSQDLFAQRSTQWRGMDRSGFYPSGNLLKEWPKGGPELLLHVEDLPESYSSVVFYDDMMYTTGIEGENEILTAIDMNGSVRWSTVYGQAWDKSFSRARTTPTIEGKYAFVISGGGTLACIELESGSLRWSFEGLSKFKGKTGTWGTAESPLIVDDKMIYTPCGNNTTMVAVDKLSGETIWKSETIGDQSAYCSPVLAGEKGLHLIITVTGNNIICVNAEDGEIFWKFKYTSVDAPKSGGDINPVTPIVRGREVFVTSGYNHVGILLEIAEDWRSVSVKWLTRDLDVHHGGVVYHQGYIYGSNYNTVITGNWVCLDWNTGGLMYESEEMNKGSVILSDGMLICYEERKGNVALVKASPFGFDIISSFRLSHGSGPHWSHPSIYNNKLFMRHGRSLLVYEIGNP